MKIALVRHSKTTIQPQLNSTLWTLSDEGREAAARLAQDTVFEGTELIYSSHQPKAIETAGIIGTALEVATAQEAGLAELSSVTNGFIADYAGTVHKLYTGDLLRINDGETLEEALDRFNKAIEAITARHEDCGKIAIVSHANVLSLFSAQYCDQEAIDLHDSIAMPDVAVLDWDGSNSTLEQPWGQATRLEAS